MSMSSVSLFVESDGIRLPDGTVFGAGIEHKYDITHGDNGGDYADVFRIYQIIDGQRISITDPLRYKEQRNWLRETAMHYRQNGMKLWKANNSDWNKATHKILVDCEY